MKRERRDTGDSEEEEETERDSVKDRAHSRLGQRESMKHVRRGWEEGNSMEEMEKEKRYERARVDGERYGERERKRGTENERK